MGSLLSHHAKWFTMAAATGDGDQEAVTEDMLADRELEWAALPHTTRKDTLPYLSAREILRLDSAMTNRQARPHLGEGLQGPGVCWLQ